jgi:hypothetical protein
MQSGHDLDQLIIDRILYLIVLHQFREMSRKFPYHALLCQPSSSRPNLVPYPANHDKLLLMDSLFTGLIPKLLSLDPFLYFPLSFNYLHPDLLSFFFNSLTFQTAIYKKHLLLTCTFCIPNHLL